MTAEESTGPNFGNVWTTQTGKLALLICAKAGCSTLGQYLYYTQAGRYWEAEIHEEGLEIMKWPDGEHQFIRDKVMSPETVVISTVRNPYRRILSAFLDKIATEMSPYFDPDQNPGEMYRGDALNPWKEKYDFGPCEPKDQIRAFENFLECLWDVSNEPHPQQSAFWDYHWTPLFPVIENFIWKRGRIDYLIRCEDLTLGLRELSWQVRPKYVPDFEKMPRFNSARVKKAYPEEDYFRSTGAQEIMQQLFWKDFEAFEYPLSPRLMRAPLPPIDLARLHQICRK